MIATRLVAITGAGGHVGAHLWHRLAESQPTRVRALVRTERTLPAWTAATAPLVGDLRSSAVRRRLLSGVDVVVHTATRGYSSRRPPSHGDLSQEVETAKTLAVEAFDSGVRRLIFVSSVHVYGSALVDAVDELTTPLPNTDYGKSRLEMEQLLADIASSYTTTAVNLRASNTFGYPAIHNSQSWDLLVHDLCRQGVQTGTLALQTNGRAYRDLLSVQAATTVMERLIQSDEVSSGVYLLGSGRTRTIREVAEWISERFSVILGYEPELIVNDLDTSEHRYFTLQGKGLGKVGIAVQMENNDELDRLLELTKREFSASDGAK